HVDDVVRAAAAPEAAVVPGDEDPAPLVDLGRGQRLRPDVAGDAVVALRGGGLRGGPGRAAVRRGEEPDAAVVGRVGHDDRAVRPYERLAAETAGGIRRRLPHAPGEAAVGRGVHLKPVAETVVVPLDIAVAVVRAARGGVADDPALVGEAGRGHDRDRVLPRQAAVGRAVDDDASAARAVVDG